MSESKEVWTIKRNLYEGFKFIDINNDDKITEEEWKEQVPKLFPKLSNWKEITIREWAEIILNMWSFKYYDENKDGLILKDELRNFLQDKQEKYDDKISQLMRFLVEKKKVSIYINLIHSNSSKSNIERLKFEEICSENNNKCEFYDIIIDEQKSPTEAPSYKSSEK